MHANHEDMEELREQLGKGSIQRAYRTLISYMMGLRTHFANKYGDSAVSGLYQGYMDMTYFAIFPPALKRRDLKAAIVFNYDAFRLEAWLAARNRKVQRQYWELFKEKFSQEKFSPGSLPKDGPWAEYRLVAPGAGIDSIIECDLAKDFDLSDSEALTARIEKDTAAFIAGMESFLSEHQPQ